MAVNAAIAIVIAYLLGSIPFAYIAGRLFKGVDIRQVGGGNIGALNTAREIGLVPGLLVLIADAGKGSLAVLVALWLDVPLILVFGAGLAAVVGHNWPVFLKFKGGKGAATTIGVLLALAPLETAISIALTVVLIVITSNVRLAVVIGLMVLPVIIWQMNGSWMLIVYSIAIFLFLCVRAMPSIIAAMTHIGDRKKLIIDREYHLWQARKSK
ncbi:MAG TPA: glycerol-3-phosphate 1-O-acyltransferase PlsY [Dehalococcoidia bacterium]|nr:glycerol-3-phosphate 1-O-acyltransferase PlsY [Dehalococcoidia bacterium]